MNMCHAFSWGLLRKEHVRTHSLCLNTWVSFKPLKKVFSFLYCMEWPSGDEHPKKELPRMCVCVCVLACAVLFVFLNVLVCLHEYGTSFMDSALLQVKIEPNSPETPCQYGLENFCFAKREKRVPTTHNYNKQTALSHKRNKGRAQNRWHAEE